MADEITRGDGHYYRTRDSLLRLHAQYPQVDWLRLVPDGKNVLSAEAAETYKRVILHEISSDPLVKRAQPELEHVSGRPWRVTTGWRALAEQKLMAGGLFMVSEDDAEVSETLAAMYGVDGPTAAVLAAIDVMDAHLYLWPEDSFELATAAPLPDRFPIDVPLADDDLMYFTWENARVIAVYESDDGKPYGTLEVNWMLLKQYDDHMRVMFDLSLSRPEGDQPVPFRIGGFSIDQDAIWPDDFRGHATAAIRSRADLVPDATDEQIANGVTLLLRVTEMVLKLMAFLRSDYTTAEPERLERHVRRQIQRQGAADADKIVVRTVHVKRRQDARATHDTGDADPEKRHYSVQWWVRGHIRRQWYASLGKHQLKWIPAHLRGPEGAPIKHATAGTVRRVD